MGRSGAADGSALAHLPGLAVQVRQQYGEAGPAAGAAALDRARRHLEDPGRLLHRIVVNACLDRMRRAKVRLADPLPEDLEDRASLDAVAGAGPVDDPEAHVLAGDRKERVFAALGELHADQRAALVLVDMEGYPVQEAARILEVPPGTIKSRCARGRARLALLLADLDTEPGESRHGTIGGPAASYSGDPPRGARPTADPPSDPPGPARRPDSGNRPHQHADPREEVSGHE